MLWLACDTFEADIFVTQRLKEDGWAIAALYGELVFHRASQTEDHGLIEEDVYTGLGDEPMDTIKDELQESIKEAKENSLLNYGREKLQKLVDEKSRCSE